MILQKIRYKITTVVQSFSRNTKGVNINWGYSVFSLICLLSIVLLGINVVRIIRKGYERYDIIREEKRRLESLLEKNQELKEELKYYSSKEFIDIKAREELNLAFPHQKLVYIERSDAGILQVEDSNSENEVVKMSPSWKLWYKLIF